MQQLREYIRKEIKRITEAPMKSYPVPPEIQNALERGLSLKPLIRYVATLKASNTVPPSYRVFFHNNQYIDLYIEQIGIKATINNKSFWVTVNGGVDQEATVAKKELNRILTQPIPVSGDEESDTESGGDTGGGDTGGGETEMEPETGGEEGGEEEA